MLASIAGVRTCRAAVLLAEGRKVAPVLADEKGSPVLGSLARFPEGQGFPDVRELRLPIPQLLAGAVSEVRLNMIHKHQVQGMTLYTSVNRRTLFGIEKSLFAQVVQLNQIEPDWFHRSTKIRE